jgi:tetraacyldisaccharide 4'-kinase
MRAPGFWERDGLLAHALAPLSYLWRASMALDRATSRARACAKPVLSVGNLVLGGAGKTPLTIALAERLKALGANPHIVGSGYGGRLPGPIQVYARTHTSDLVGDEALLLAQAAPTWIARDRGQGARAALAAGAGVIVLDDGHQTWELAKDLALLAVDAEYGFGNGRVFPAGPLRERVAQGLARAHGIVLIGPAEHANTALAAILVSCGKPLVRARIAPLKGSANLRGQKVIAFAGIGRPEKFFATVAKLGAEVVGAHPFANHHPYTAGEMHQLITEAGAREAKLVTTAKDAVRLPASLKDSVTVVPVKLEFEDPALIDRWLLSLLGRQ